MRITLWRYRVFGLALVCLSVINSSCRIQVGYHSETPAPPTVSGVGSSPNSSDTPPPNSDGVTLFQISPLTATIAVSGTTTFIVSGGSAPYAFEVYYGSGSINASSGLYTAPAVRGTSVIKVTDVSGLAAYATIDVTDGPVISPQTLSLAASNSYPFSVSGGKAPYTFSIVTDTSSGSVSSSTGVFTAGASQGQAVIRVTDSAGANSQATVTINSALSISPGTVTVAPDQSKEFTASGGVGSYSFRLLSGNGELNADDGTFQAPSSVGMAVVQVRDALGNSAVAIVTISSPMSASPYVATITKSTSITYTVAGGVAPYSFEVSAEGGSVGLLSGQYTAPSSAGGPHTVTITDSLGQSVQAQVTVAESLDFKVSNVSLPVGGTHNFASVVTGGVGNKTFSVPSSHGSFSSSTYTAPGTPGVYTISVMDSQSPTPNQAQATVTVNPALSMSPASATIAVGNPQAFSAAGGVPPYTYGVDVGAVTSSGLYTAPQSAGTATVTVTDSYGSSVPSSVTINPALQISPASKILLSGASQSFSATGGVGTYTYQLVSGGGSVDGSTGEYTASNSAGLARVRVTDVIGNKSEAPVTLIYPVGIFPETVFLLTNSQITFGGLGGIAPYGFTVLSGVGSIGSSTGVYTAPGSTGQAVVRVTDSLGSPQDASVTIYSGLAISPFAKTVIVNRTTTFTALGGVGPYTYSVLSGSGSINAITGEYTAPGEAGSAVIRVIDQVGSTSDAAVTVNAAPSISPGSKTLAVNNTVSFTASGGITPYVYSLHSGSGTLNTSTGDYTAPASSGLAAVRVTDSEGNTADAEITINGALAISPAARDLIAGATVAFEASGGVAPYIYSVLSGGGSFSSADYTAPGAPGSAVVRVTDSLGNGSNGVVQIYAALAISPASKTLAVNNVFTLTASGGKLPYAYSVVSADGTGSVGSSSGVYTAPGAATSATVRVTDALNQVSESALTINSVLSISPSAPTVAAGGTQLMSASGGVAPYVYSVVSGLGSVSSATYTAPSVGSGSTDTVRVTDSLGNISNSTITIPAISVAIGAPTPSSYINNSNYSSLTVSGTCSESSRTVSVSATGDLSATPTCSGGSWSTNLDFTSVSDGEIVIRANHSNSNNVAATEASVTVTKDRVTPTLAIGTPTDGSYIFSSNVAAFEVSGTCSANGRSVTVAATGGLSATPTCSAGAWSTSFDFSSVDDGSITITADHSSVAGNSATQATVTLTKDVTAPTITTVAVQTGLTVDVTFSKAMGSGVTTAANYTVSGTGKGTLANNPNSVELVDDKYRLTWTSGKMYNGGNITIAAASAQDTVGNAVDSSGTHSGGAIGAAPTVTGLADDATATQSKTWSWGCSETCAYRYAVNTSSSWSAAGEFDSTNGATQSAGDGTYYLHVQAQDSVGNQSAVTSVSALLDNTGPSAPASIGDGTWWSSTTTSPVISWSTVAGGDFSHYEVAVGTSAGATNVASWTSTSSFALKQFSDLTLSDGATYYASVKAVDVLGNGSAVTQGNGWIVDIVAPSTPGSLNDGTSTNRLTEAPQASWQASSDAASGMSHYEVAIGTSAGASDVYSWTSVGDVTSVTVTGLSLTFDVTYYTSVRAVDVAGNTSTVAEGDGWLTVGWNRQAYLKAPNAGASDSFGFRGIAISGDTIVVGSNYEDSNQTTITNGTTASSDNSMSDSGAVYVFKRTGSSWAQEAYIKASNAGASDEFGINVGIDGDTIVVGAYMEDSNQTSVTNGTSSSSNNSATDSGAAYVYKRTGSSWAQEAYLKASNGVAGDGFGYAVSISGDTIAVGAYARNSVAGAVYAFKRTGSSWAQEAIITASNAAASDRFGFDVSISVDTIVVGSPFQSTTASTSGAAYVYKRTGSSWAEEAILKASNAAAADYFGRAVSISVDTIVVGSTNQDTTASNSGAAYVYKRTGSSWAEEAILKASNAGASDYFGYSVAILGDTIVVGAYAEDSNQSTITNGTAPIEDNSASDSGAAYVFTRTGSSWAQTAYLKASNVGAGDSFGLCVAISSDTIVVGASYEDSQETTITNGTTGGGDDNNASAAGAAYVFKL